MSSNAGVRRLLSLASAPAEDCRLLLDSITDYAIVLLDGEGRIITWNAGAEKITGYSSQEILGQHFSRFYPPDDISAGKPDQHLKAAREAGRAEDEMWRLHKDGTRFWANVVTTAIRDESGALRGFGQVTRDLSERRAAEEALRRSEERFHHLVDAATDYAFFMLDSAGRIMSWNRGAEKIKGYSAEEIVGEHFSVFYTPEDQAAGKPRRMLETVQREGRVEDEGWRVRKDGTRFWANVIITQLWGGPGKPLGFAKVTRDLTARRQAEETERNLLREQAARAAAENIAHRAAEANRIKDEFLATVSHELRTPLNAIVGWASLLRQRDLDPSVARAIDVIDRNARAQVKIVEDILDVSRIITGKLRLDPKPADLVAITQQALDAIRDAACAKQLSVRFQPDSEVCLLVADPERLQQVVLNLLSNAVKFTGLGGDIQVTLRQDKSRSSLSVSDTGMGISADLLPLVFDRFRQGDSSTTRNVGGLGLGLALVRHIVELHGGTVAAESAGLGRGSRFTVTLPVRASAPALRSEPAPEVPRPSARLADVLSGLRVLVVDDDPDATEVLSLMLSQAGALVESSNSAAAAFDALRRFQPHLLVSDIGMPGEDGYSFIRRVRALNENEGGAVPAIALTAYTRNEDRAKALAAGFTTHIGKPVDPSNLMATVQRLAVASR